MANTESVRGEQVAREIYLDVLSPRLEARRPPPSTDEDEAKAIARRRPMGRFVSTDGMEFLQLRGAEQLGWSGARRCRGAVQLGRSAARPRRRGRRAACVRRKEIAHRKKRDESVGLCTRNFNIFDIYKQ